MKVHIVTSANKEIYGSEIEQMHRLRHRVFVEELGWRGLESPDGIERDNFDDEAAVYLIACEEGQVYGSVRLLPTWRRCMVTEVWPEFIDGTLPGRPEQWEWTRWCPGSMSDRRHLIRARAALILAALEFAGSRGITRYLTFCDVKFVSQLQDLGWSPEPLGQRLPIHDGLNIAVQWAVTPRSLAETRRFLKVVGPVSFEAPVISNDESFLRPWMLERLLSATKPDDVGAISNLLSRIQVTTRFAANDQSRAA